MCVCVCVCVWQHPLQASPSVGRGTGHLNESFHLAEFCSALSTAIYTSGSTFHRLMKTPNKSSLLPNSWTVSMTVGVWPGSHCFRVWFRWFTQTNAYEQIRGRTHAYLFRRVMVLNFAGSSTLQQRPDASASSLGSSGVGRNLTLPSGINSPVLTRTSRPGILISVIQISALFCLPANQPHRNTRFKWTGSCNFLLCAHASYFMTFARFSLTFCHSCAASLHSWWNFFFFLLISSSVFFTP